MIMPRQILPLGSACHYVVIPHRVHFADALRDLLCLAFFASSTHRDGLRACSPEPALSWALGPQWGLHLHARLSGNDHSRVRIFSQTPI